MTFLVKELMGLFAEEWGMAEGEAEEGCVSGGLALGVSKGQMCRKGRGF